MLPLPLRDASYRHLLLLITSIYTTTLGGKDGLDRVFYENGGPAAVGRRRTLCAAHRIAGTYPWYIQYVSPKAFCNRTVALFSPFWGTACGSRSVGAYASRLQRTFFCALRWKPEDICCRLRTLSQAAVDRLTRGPIHPRDMSTERFYSAGVCVDFRQKSQ